MVSVMGVLRKAEAKKKQAEKHLKRSELVTGRILRTRRTVANRILALKDAGQSVPPSLYEKYEGFQTKLAAAAKKEVAAQEALKAAGDRVKEI